LAAIRKEPGCSNIQGIAINRVWISTLKIIGRYAYHLRERLMPTRPPVRRYLSKTYCGAIMI